MAGVVALQTLWDQTGWILILPLSYTSGGILGKSLHISAHHYLGLQQWFSTFSMLRASHTVSHVVVTPP